MFTRYRTENNDYGDVDHLGMLSSSYLIHTLFELESYQSLHSLDSGFWKTHKSLFSYFGS